MYKHQTLIETIEQENALKFEKFDNNDAIKLGSYMIEIGKNYSKPIAVRVFINKYIAYQCLMQGTTDFHCGYLDRKQNVVNKTHLSSLRYAVEKQESTKKLAWWENRKKYVFCGGGFPIFVKDKYIGVAICSGLSDLEDHEIVVLALKKLLNK